MRLTCDPTLSVAWFYHQIAPPERSATIVAKGTYQLVPNEPARPADQPALVSGDLYEQDDPTKGLQYATDFAPFKPRADLLLRATAHAPNQRPTDYLSVRWRVGNWSKALDVFGKRTMQGDWLRGAKLSRPEPFTEMPLAYEFAYGGPDWKANPVGRGRQGEEAPRIELPGQPPTGSKTAPLPAGFGPLAASWEPRCLRLGTYDQNWLKTRWPWFPKDCDWGHFNAAPPDQQLAGYLKGDEELEFDYLHPTHSYYRSRLPGIRSRCFILDQEGSTRRFREVPLRLDTLWIDLEAEQLILVWRGQAAVRTPKLKEVERLIFMTEPLGQPALPSRAIQIRLEQQEAELAQRQAEAEAAAAAAQREKQAAFDRQADLLEQEAEAIEAQAGDLVAQKAVERRQQGFPEFLAESETPLEQQLAAYREHLKAWRATLEQEHPELAATAPAADPNELAALFTEMEPPRKLTRQDVEQALKTGASLAERDLSGLNLSALAAGKMDWSRSLLRKANLKGTCLAGACLAGANLSEADLSETDLRGAILDGADLTGARLSKALLAGASLNGATLAGLDLSAMDLTDCRAEKANFAGANLRQAVLRRCRLRQANLSGCNLEAADLREAQLSAAQCEGVQARGILLEGADVTGIHASGRADFRDARARGLQGRRSIWESSCLEGADFSRAQLPGAQFSDAALQRANFDRANLVGGVFSGADLRDCQLTRANLLRAAFDGADLSGTNLEDSNLYDAGFFEAITDRIRVRGANLKNTLLG